eukprot:TRINITY_DN2517_c0_g1_i2.p3 TRINITY_DN2517_c0_g1~~TRINITY_DN2517_c0_g1_i2.p3  ORF type:complete len:196 (+),score=60.80 TRINITY_DN2517_c0_g1_i2:1653-2240(+)
MLYLRCANSCASHLMQPSLSPRSAIATRMLCRALPHHACTPALRQQLHHASQTTLTLAALSRPSHCAHALPRSATVCVLDDNGNACSKILFDHDVPRCFDDCPKYALVIEHSVPMCIRNDRGEPCKDIEIESGVPMCFDGCPKGAKVHEHGMVACVVNETTGKACKKVKVVGNEFICFDGCKKIKHKHNVPYCAD